MTPGQQDLICMAARDMRATPAQRLTAGCVLHTHTGAAGQLVRLGGCRDGLERQADCACQNLSSGRTTKGLLHGCSAAYQSRMKLQHSLLVKTSASFVT
jgi:hypothetical protein